MLIFGLFQVVQMQCNMELNEDKTQWHVSIQLLFYMRHWGKICSLYPSLASDWEKVWSQLVCCSTQRTYSCPFIKKEA